MKTSDFPSWLAVPSVNFTPGRDRAHAAAVKGLVMHFTAAGSGRRTAEYFAPKDYVFGGKTYVVGVSAHLVIDRDGTVYQCVALADTAWHAGPARQWAGKPLAKGDNCNAWTVGIEIANWGELTHQPDGSFKNYQGGVYKGLPPVHGADTRTGEMKFWEPYAEAQILAVIVASKVVMHAFPAIATRSCVQGHEAIQSNKNDPGPAFPWRRVLDELFDDEDAVGATGLMATQDDPRR